MSAVHTDIERFLDTSEHHRAQVILIDDQFAGKYKTSQIIHRLHDELPLVRIILLSDILNERYVQRILRDGAYGYIYKGDRLEGTLTAGIETVYEGHVYLSPRVSSLPYGSPPIEQLNKTDMEVLRLMSEGYTVQEISARAHIVDRTVYRVRSRLRDYLGVRTNEQVLDAARKRGLFEECRE